MKHHYNLTFSLLIRTAIICLGFAIAMSVLKMILDAKQQSKLVSENVESILETTLASASEVAWRASTSDAELLMKGLAHHDFLASASITTEYGAVLSEYNNSLRHQGVLERAFLSLFVDHVEERNLPLTKEINGETKNVGVITVAINNHAALADLYDRTVFNFLLSLLSLGALTITLGTLYHYTLANPLKTLADHFYSLSAKNNIKHQLPHISNNPEDEFSLIVDAANKMLTTIADSRLLLDERHQHLRLILDTTDAVVFAINHQQNIVFANNATSIFLNRSISTIKDSHIFDVVSPIDSDLYCAITNFIRSCELRYEQVIKVKNASRQEQTLNLLLIKYISGRDESVLITATDVSARIEAEEKVEYLAFFDPLTGLPNRNKVTKLFSDDSKKGTSKGIAVLVDIDNFRRLNESLGYQLGDTIISTIAQNLSKTFSPESTVARLSGDEFFCVFPEALVDDSNANVRCKQLAESVRKCINKPITVQNITYSLSASIGVVCYEHPCDANLVIQQAKTAMCEAKRQGKNRITVFEGNMAARAASILKMELGVKDAIANNEFYFDLQPIFSSDGTLLKCAEVLMRWRRDDEDVPPLQFIPFLEESGLIVEVGEDLIRQTIEFLRKQLDLGTLPDGFVLAVNLSVKQIAQPDFVDAMEFMLRHYGVSGRLLEFEITESAALENKEDTIEKIKQLGELGIRFALDDFGTGYSSLSYLKDLPIQKLKIDRSFVSDLGKNERSNNLVNAIIQLSQNFSLTIVAEGVETEEQLQWVTGNGVDLVQGYCFEKPMSVNSFEDKYCTQQSHIISNTLASS
ncbi:MAG: EAL domain-containing protein [Pseudomonadota bacterium]